MKSGGDTHPSPPFFCYNRDEGVMDMRVVIIGGDAAGMSAASKLRRLDESSEIIVFERGSDVSYSACGMPYHLKGEIEQESHLYARRPEDFQKQDIDLRLLHEVTALDAEKKEITVKDRKNDKNSTHTYDKLVIATGADGIRLGLEGTDKERVFTFNDMEDMRRLKRTIEAKAPERAVIVGGGFIGVELAEAFHAKGIRTSIHEREAEILPQLDREFGRAAREEMERHGIAVATRSTVRGYEERDGRYHVLTTAGEEEADFVVEAVGVRPNTDFLKGSGLEYLPNGAIRVNDAMETALADVYAAGDVASVYHRILERDVHVPLGTHANKAGRVIAERIAGRDARFPGVLGSFVVKVFTRTAAKTGLSLQEAKKAGIAAEEATIEAPSRAGYYPGKERIKVRIVYDPKDNRLLGFQLFGADGVAQRLHAAAVALWAAMDAATFRQADLAYAPPFSPVYDPLLVCANQIK